MKLTARLLSLLLSASLLLGLLPCGVAAAEPERRACTGCDLTPKVYPVDRATTIVPLASTKSGRMLKSNASELDKMLYASDLIRDALLAGRTSVDLSGLGVSIYHQEEFDYLPRFCPYLDGDSVNGELYYYTDTGRYAHIEIRNRLTRTQTREWIEQVDAKLAELYAVADRSLPLLDRALALHDYIAANYRYDTRAVIANSSYHLGGILTRGVGVCLAYSMVYQYILNMEGVECYTVTSEAMNHAWNLISLNGRYYNIDVTWDDPTNDLYGQARHNYFLLSDATICDADHGHYGRNMAYRAATDRSYESAYFVGATSPIVRFGNYRYYCADGALQRFDLTTRYVTRIRDLGYWYVGSSCYVGTYSGLFSYGGRLYFNDYSSIYAMDLSTESVKRYFTADTAAGGIHGIVQVGSELRYAYQYSMYDDERARSIRSLRIKALHEGCPGSQFSDLPDYGSWAHDGIDQALSAGLFSGTSASTFSPNGTMTRAMLVVVLWRMEGEPRSGAQNPFWDVPYGQWYTDAVLWAQEQGIVTGVGDGRFCPDGKLSREQIATILYRYAARRGRDTSQRANLYAMPDAREVSSWALDAMSWANACGLINGTRVGSSIYLQPTAKATRAQVAAILMRYRSL